MAQSVELLTRDVHELGHQVAEVREGLRDVGKFVSEVAEGTARLLNIAEIHEKRITRLEGASDAE